MLRIKEIFYSIQGESTFVGLPTIFIRLTGCPLRCQYCDTTYAFSGGTRRSITEILSEIKVYKTRFVTVTGGEPLAQKQCIDLMDALIEQNYTVSLETSGAIDVALVNEQVVKVIDIKTPGSKESHQNKLSNLAQLNPMDQLKFVICSKEDYEWSKDFIEKHALLERCHILFSPSYHQVDAKSLAQWILEDSLAVRMQLQLHKAIWGEKPGV